ncbi:MAG: hypothetical protein Q9175_003096 [Cornicularia normoerica]
MFANTRSNPLSLSLELAMVLGSDSMGLPRELRVMEYELCLPIGEELVLKPTACDREDIAAGVLRATLFRASFRVNKINTRRIIEVPEGLRLPAFFNKHVHEAMIMCDRRILRIDDLWDISGDVFEGGTWGKSRLGEIHDNLKEHLLEIWMDKGRALGKLHLRELTALHAGNAASVLLDAAAWLRVSWSG